MSLRCESATRLEGQNYLWPRLSDNKDYKDREFVKHKLFFRHVPRTKNSYPAQLTSRGFTYTFASVARTIVLDATEDG